MAEGFREHGFPDYTAQQAAAGDAQLNRDYEQPIAAAPADCGNEDGCVARPAMREMERAWIRYRDAWVAFWAVRWPRVSADSWRVYLTLQRIAMGGDGGGE
ncbi:MAG: lysozyme inhibitor LprI family protein [Acidobacteriaceae bacterium]